MEFGFWRCGFRFIEAASRICDGLAAEAAPRILDNEVIALQETPRGLLEKSANSCDIFYYGLGNASDFVTDEGSC